MLLSMGKEQLYVFQLDASMLHENDAAQRLAAICKGPFMEATEVSEGKIELTAKRDGLFIVDISRLNQINALEEIIIATRPSGTPVHAGDKLCGTRVIPLVIEKAKLQAAQAIAGAKPLLALHPFLNGLRAGIVTTGSEVFHGRIRDQFTPIVVQKLAEAGIETAAHLTVDDGKEHIERAICQLREQGLNLICCTGGMSVDPDDRTPAAIRASGANVVSYGAPVLPGAMFLIGYYDDGVPIVGLPGCVMYARRTVFDLMLPYLAAGVPITREMIARLGNGGLCLSCDNCTFPNCGFGK